jgi:hypothetical protein
MAILCDKPVDFGVVNVGSCWELSLDPYSQFTKGVAKELRIEFRYSYWIYCEIFRFSLKNWR